jgi:hypothetical protein
MEKNMRYAAISLFLCMFVAACATVPEETVVLSREQGRTLAELQRSHESFVHLYFSESRARIRDFIQNRWAPVFMETFIEESGVMPLLDEPDRGEVLLSFTQAAVTEIRGQETALLSQVDALETTAMNEIRASYTQARMMNEAVTAHLASIRDVQSAREDLLRRVDPSNVLDSGLQSVLSTVDKVRGIIDRAEDVKSSLSDLKTVLDGNPAE